MVCNAIHFYHNRKQKITNAYYNEHIKKYKINIVKIAVEILQFV
jgi:hypothetical protein